MTEYTELKQRLLMITALLTMGGSGIAALAVGVDAAIPFAVGGMAGVIYQFLLQIGVDAAVPNSIYHKVSGTEKLLATMNGILGSASFRLAMVTVAGLVAAWCVQESTGR